ncbi:carboxylesterase/lipase family protein [Microbacterium thalassium]|uniref:Carboxylic ester hydrolase n=1 Tax=Microbacterium thalassium TaxID=362649 RepID=A0A7X0KU74_9MICO|nr:carboxylesterase family protein [Microbacterium thalassium]MBB6390870.1 para-nitrobenzyl esterase [Microbacterium thalassium]GLK25978.1 carboxylic ester hydrolase [Microbacterium thalassium]
MTAAGEPIVRIGSGSVRGRWRGTPGTEAASAAFLGIPFAQPPVGDLRFAAPVAVEPWDGILDAADHGATPQRGDTGITLIPEPSVPGDSTLNVNVFTPRPGEADAALPVLVYIHGGGFVSGSPASPWYDGASFSRDGIVTVVVSYRLGFDGFGHIDGAPSNRGVRDWLAALEWVRQNIAAFGGDPGRVTIAGQSAGGGAVLTLLGMPAAQHLFHAAWSLSGPLRDISPGRAQQLSAELARLAGVPATRAGFATVPEDRLRDLQQQVAAPASTSALGPIVAMIEDGLAWGPAIDGDLIVRPTIEAIRDGVGADKPLVLGATDDEFTMVTAAMGDDVDPAPALALLLTDPASVDAYLDANRAHRGTSAAALLGRFVSDAVFRSSVVRVARARAAAPTWVYRFSWASPTFGWAIHCVDVPFWFDCLDAPGVAAIAGDSPPAALADAVHGSAVALIRDGDPGWEPWSRSTGSTRVFDDGAASGVHADGYASVHALV